MDEKALHVFYTYAILPQFGLQACDVMWHPGEPLGPDESLHRFSANKRSYGLIFEDNEGLGYTDAFIRDTILFNNEPYDFIPPLAETSISPSYNGFRLPTPFQYCAQVTGTFTLVEFLHLRKP